MLLLRRDAQPADAGLLAALSGDLSGDAELAEVLTELRAHPVMDRAREVTAQWATDARVTLEPLPDVPARRALASLSDFVVRRSG